MAVGVLQAARRRGLRVPEDLSVASFDDGPVAEAAGLTTVRQPFEESGAAAFRLLGAAATSRLRVRSELQLTLTTRSSTGPAPREG
jgi:DNA-binding LacI/PurR family transcriptional regulator